ncbi:MAG: HAD family hydrolase [Verrucomicrobia bacterium]|nr:HAD family hydrolase [Verrucomicrobiota bacterium]
MTEKPVRIAMWSGPRNISTAMMRAWGQRGDTAVIDEPFYGFYLKQTGVAHPEAGEVMAASETDWRKVVAQLAGPVPKNARIFYQKQMTHHLLPEIARDWLRSVTNCFLIRNPAAVIASYAKKCDKFSIEDLGFPQQLEIFNLVRRFQRDPPIVDADDVLRAPELQLRKLCDAAGVRFDPAMLSWPPGRRDTDGIWAKHWYADVERSTGFQPYVGKEHMVPERFSGMYERCREIYDELYPMRLQ